MKRYLVCDDYSECYKKVMSYEEIRNLLIEELERDTLENRESKDIVKNNFQVIKNLIKNEFDYLSGMPMWRYVKDQLRGFGYSIQDLTELQQDLSNYQAYKHGVGAPSYPNDCIEQTLKMIEEEMK